MRGSHNLLVISDLHLGEDLNPSATEESIRDLQLAERHLIAFLEHYTRRRSDGLPWRLVIDGDMVDLVRIFLPPEQLPGSPWVAIDVDERKHGLGRRMDASCIKIEAVVGRHRTFVEALARFLAAGNRVEIVCGNHDAELFWPEVQETLRHGVVQAWRGLPDAARAGAPDADQLAARLGFHDWFYYEPGVAWIEHGHQYDECCSIEHHLYPVAPDGRFLVHNIDSASLRYLTNMVPDLAPHGSEDWTMAGYLRLTYEAGPRTALQIARGYFVTAAKLLAAWRASRQLRQERLRRDHHLLRLRALSAAGPLGEDRLRALCGLHRRPVVTSLRRLLQVLMLDKLLLWPAVLLLALVAALALPGVWALLSGLGILAAAGLVHHWLGRGRNVDPVLPLDLVPERILEQVDARFVVFGHTHLPVARPLANGRWYFNSGTWMPSGKPGLLRCFTHVLIRHTPDGPVASLCQWRDGASQEFTSTPGRPGAPVRRARSPERLATPLGTPVAGRAAAAFSRPPSSPALDPVSDSVSGPDSGSLRHAGAPAAAASSGTAFRS
jgi:UDP-2,3-diacylglucosamine pyrophosphatase LpxH